MQVSASLTLARALFALVGAGILAMAISNLASGQSLSDPVFPAGIALGVVMLGAAAWVQAAGRAQALVVWLGLVGVAITLVVGAGLVLRTPSPDVLALAAVPTLIMVAGGVRLAMARVAARAFGA